MNVLKTKASKSFEKYVDLFKNAGKSYLIPKQRLSDAEWDELNTELAKDSLEMIPVEKDNHMYMKFRKLSRDEKKKKLFNAGVLKNINGIIQRAEHISGVSGWEYKAKSGLGFEHVRLPIDKMPKSKIDDIVDQFREKGVDLEIINTNKGKYLVFNTEKYRNFAPDNYKPNNKIKHGIYHSSNVVLSELIKSAIQKILNTKIPENRDSNLSPKMQVYTKGILQKYEMIGVIDMRKLDQLADKMRQNLMEELANVPDIADKILKWDSLSAEQKNDLAEDINYITGSQRADHSGQTIVAFGNMSPGHHGLAYGGTGSITQFGFNKMLLDDFDTCIGTIVHENVHRFQNHSKSAIPKNVRDYVDSIIDTKSTTQYINDISECESRYIQAFVRQNFLRDFTKYYTQKRLMEYHAHKEYA